MPNSTPVDVFTISSNNYLGMTRVFAESYLEFHPGATVYVCLVDHLDERVPYDEFPFTIILAEDLDIPSFRNFSFRFDILELNTAVKPFVIKYLRDTKNLDRVFYFDPDILVHDRLTGLEEALSENLAVLTPHLTEPLDNICRPPERVIGMCGIYNLGFLGLRLDERTEGFLDWWCDRLHRFCINDLSNGMFVDQSWMDFTPAYLETVAIVREPIYNIAYWNLPHRFPEYNEAGHWEVDGSRVGFFHFSGVNPKQVDVISKHQDRLDLWSRPELRPLFEHYADLVLASGQYELKSLPYAYHCFRGTDIPIPRSARVALQETDPEGLRWADPFDAECEDPYLDWLVEPLWFDHGVTNRAALFMWRERADVRDAFPRVTGEDLPRFMNWYLDEGASQANMHEVFTGHLRTIWDNRPDDVIDDEVTLESVDAGDPGEHLEWLNEAVGDGSASPVVTRLAQMVHDSRPEVKDLYPDLLGRDRGAFVYWMVVHGAPQHGLHPDLVKPLRRSLPLKSRLALALKGVPSDGRGRGQTWTGAASAKSSRPVPVRQDCATRPSPCGAGVNLVGFFEGSRGARCLSLDIRALIGDAGIPCVEVALDHELPDLMTSEQIRHRHGAPNPVTILDVPAERFEGVVDSLPFGTRIGGGLIGYLTQAPEHLHPDLFRRLDELWVPTEAACRFLADKVSIPVRHVPCVLHPSRADRESVQTEDLVLDEGVSWFVLGDADDGVNGPRVVSAAIDCIRRLVSSGRHDIGLVYLADGCSGSMVKEVGHLPIRVIAEPLSTRLCHDVLRASAGVLLMRSAPRVDALLLAARELGKPVVASRSSILDDGRLTGQLFDAAGLNDNPAALVAPAATALSAVVDRIDVRADAPENHRIDIDAVADQWSSEVARVVGRNQREG